MLCYFKCTAKKEVECETSLWKSYYNSESKTGWGHHMYPKNRATDEYKSDLAGCLAETGSMLRKQGWFKIC